MLTLDSKDTRSMMDTKFWTAYYCAKHLCPLLKDGGSVVFVAGILNRRPGINCAPLAVVNGALEGLTRSLALAWRPKLRVNCLSPGFCDTERFDHMPAEKKQAMLQNTAASLPLQKVGRPQDMGEALYYLATAQFVTGVVLDVDGGHTVRQYANPTSDPMRSSSKQYI
jgi:NAD(P)-dependent dehydrogenase (short-subunit alcohol dehydrogenase family)